MVTEDDAVARSLYPQDIESRPRERCREKGLTWLRMRSRTRDAERAHYRTSAAADERLATVLVSARRVEPYRIDAARDG